MATASDLRWHGVAALLVVTCTSVLVWFGNGLNPWWPLLWGAPLPVLLFAARSSWGGTALVAAASWFIGSLDMWHYFQVLHAPPFVWAIIYSLATGVFTGAVLLFRALLRQGAWVSAWLAFPAAYVSGEYMASLLTSGGTAGSLAYTQLDFLPFLQLASITGPAGLSFLLLLFSATIAISLHLSRKEPAVARRILGGGLGIIVLALIFGALRLAGPTSHQRIKVGLIASDEPANVDVADVGAATGQLLRDYAREAEKLAARGAKIIVLPEKLGVTVDPDTAGDDTLLQALVDRTGVTIVVGLIHVSPTAKHNQARVYAPRTPVLSYDKQHMLPPFESKFEPGTALTLLSVASGTQGVTICKDMDFTSLPRCYGQAGAGMLLVPAWDFNLDRWGHGHIAVMRGVEDGFSVVRAAKQGYLTVSDDRGRILGEIRSDAAPFTTLLTKVPTGHHATVYLWLGDWFAWLAMAIFLSTCARVFWGRSAAAQ